MPLLSLLLIPSAQSLYLTGDFQINFCVERRSGGLRKTTQHYVRPPQNMTANDVADDVRSVTLLFFLTTTVAFAAYLQTVSDSIAGKSAPVGRRRKTVARVLCDIIHVIH